MVEPFTALTHLVRCVEEYTFILQGAHSATDKNQLWSYLFMLVCLQKRHVRILFTNTGFQQTF